MILCPFLKRTCCPPWSTHFLSQQFRSIRRRSQRAAGVKITSPCFTFERPRRVQGNMSLLVGRQICYDRGSESKRLDRWPMAGGLSVKKKCMRGGCGGLVHVPPECRGPSPL